MAGWPNSEAGYIFIPKFDDHAGKSFYKHCFKVTIIIPCTIKSRRSIQAPAHPGGPGKRAVK